MFPPAATWTRAVGLCGPIYIYPIYLNVFLYIVIYYRPVILLVTQGDLPITTTRVGYSDVG